MLSVPRTWPWRESSVRRFCAGENVLTHAVMCRRQPEPGLLHIIAGGDESERLRGAWIVQAEACGADRQGYLGIAGRQALRVIVVAQRHGNLATLQSRRATIPGIRHSGATVALHCVLVPRH